MQNIQIGKIYRHYKGNLYKVVAIGKHSETEEEMVVYSSLDNNHVWIRPLRMWSEIVDSNDTLRFTIVN